MIIYDNQNYNICLFYKQKILCKKHSKYYLSFTEQPGKKKKLPHSSNLLSSLDSEPSILPASQSTTTKLESGKVFPNREFRESKSSSKPNTLLLEDKILPIVLMIPNLTFPLKSGNHSKFLFTISRLTTLTLWSCIVLWTLLIKQW